MLKDIVISGDGLAGRLAAIALTKQGFDVTLIGRDETKIDNRTTALLMPSIRFFQQHGLWDTLIHQSQALCQLKIIDKAAQTTFIPTEGHESVFGYNISNSQLHDRLRFPVNKGHIVALSQRHDHVKLVLDSGLSMATKLLIVAEGRNSTTRNLLGIKAPIHDLAQQALSFCVEHSFEHHGISTEIHGDGQSLTFIPMQGKQSAIVWMMGNKQAHQMRQLDQCAIRQRLGEISHNQYGDIGAIGALQAWPVQTMAAEQFIAHRAVIIAETAHVVPPMGAQGLNISISDVMHLCQHLNPQDPGAQAGLTAYENQRLPATRQRVRMMKGLDKVAISHFWITAFARGKALDLINHAPHLRQKLINYGMGF